MEHDKIGKLSKNISNKLHIRKKLKKIIFVKRSNRKKREISFYRNKQPNYNWYRYCSRLFYKLPWNLGMYREYTYRSRFSVSQIKRGYIHRICSLIYTNVDKFLDRQKDRNLLQPDDEIQRPKNQFIVGRFKWNQIS